MVSSNLIEFIFFSLAGLVIAENFYTLFVGIQQRRQKRCFIISDSKITLWIPKVALIVPCKGLDPGFRENIQALFHQDYSNYHLLFVTATAEDAAFFALTEIIRENPQVPSRLLTAGSGLNCSQKVHNLKVAVQKTDPDDEIYVFADSDIRPHPDWLRELITPLIEAQVGATTGYRWYLSNRGNFGSLLRTVWNGNVLPVLEDSKLNFAWGGSMAVPRKIFEKAGVLKSWEGVLSDDYALTWALKNRGYQILFVPRCLVLSHEDCSLKEFLEWSVRQMTITRIYHPLLWKLAAFSFVNYNLVLVFGIALLLLNSPEGSKSLLTWSIMISLVGFPLIKSSFRLKTVLRILSNQKRLEQLLRVERQTGSYILLSPIVAILNFYISFRSAITNRITWRGVIYEIESPTKILIHKMNNER